MGWEFAHNSNGLPIHASQGQKPHVAIRDYDAGGTWHVPYVGQTTLGMYGAGQPGESFDHVDKFELGGLDHSKATFRPWR